MRSLKGIAPYKRTSLRWLFPAALILRHSGDHTWAAPTSSSHLTGHNDGRVSLCARISATLSPISLRRHWIMNDDTVIRDGHAPHVRPGQELLSTEQTAKGASARSRPGILIFSRGRKLLQMNSRALELTGHLNQAEIGPVHNICSASVRDLSAQIQEMLDHRREVSICGIFELKRVIRRLTGDRLGLRSRLKRSIAFWQMSRHRSWLFGRMR